MFETAKNIIQWWNDHPCNAWHSDKPQHTIEYSKEVSDHRLNHQSHVSSFFDSKSLQNKRILEIGCGIGTDALFFAKAGGNYVGIDVSETSINIAKQRFHAEQVQGEFYIRNGAIAEVLDDLGQFDLVYCWGVMHHWPDDRGFVDNFYSCLNDHGKLILMIYNKHSWKNALVRSNLQRYEAQPNCPYVKCYSEEEIMALLDNKFVIESVDLAGLMQYNVEKYKQKIFEKEPWFQAMPVDMIQAIEKYLGECMIVTATKIPRKKA